MQNNQSFIERYGETMAETSTNMSANLQIGWGVIGTSNIVKDFMGATLSKANYTKFIAVCSRNMNRAKSFANKFGAKRAYNSLAKMLEDPEIDVIYISTPHHLHASQVIQVAKAGKHVLCEKPMALNVSDAKKMIESCKENEVKLGVNFQNRFHPGHIEAKNYISNTKKQKVYFANAQYCHGYLEGHWTGWRNDSNKAGAGALMATGIHAIDLLRFILDSKIIRVRALLDNKTPHHKVDEMVYLILEFDNETVATVISGILAPHAENNVILYGSNKKIFCKNTLGTKLKGDLLIGQKGNIIKKQYTSNKIGLYLQLVNSFNKSIKQNKKLDNGISGENGLQMVKIANAIIKSSKQNKTIEIDKNLN